MDADTIIAGLLHDVVEDCEISLKTVKKEFGNNVAKLVDGMTKLLQLDDKLIVKLKQLSHTIYQLCYVITKFFFYCL